MFFCGSGDKRPINQKDPFSARGSLGEVKIYESADAGRYNLTPFGAARGRRVGLRRGLSLFRTGRPLRFLYSGREGIRSYFGDGAEFFPRTTRKRMDCN